MKLQDLKTLDEVYEFGKAAKFYKVTDFYPFKMEEVTPLGRLQVSFDSDKNIYWNINEKWAPSMIPLFDNFNEAKKFSLEQLIAYNEHKTAQAQAELKKLKGDAQ